MTTAHEEKISNCYKSLSVSPQYLKGVYDNGGLSYKIKNSKLNNFTIEPMIDIQIQQEIIQHSTQLMSLFVPIDIIDYIIDFVLSETQLFIESKAKQIYKTIDIILNKDKFPLYLCRNIATYSGGFCWDGEFWCYRSKGRPLNKYAYMNRVVYWCGNQDVIYCKSDEFCYGSRYFVRILIDHKQDEIWCGIMFNDLSHWSSYYHERNQIAYYGGRRRKTNNLKQKFKTQFPTLYDEIQANMHSNIEGKDIFENKSLELEMNIIEKKNELMNRNFYNYLWDMGLGIIQGRDKLLSDALPWYGTADTIGILVDTKEGIVYFYREDMLVWYIKDDEIKVKNMCKVFGCTDETDDTLIYERILWNDNREKDLQAQIKKMKKTVDLYDSTEN